MGITSWGRSCAPNELETSQIVNTTFLLEESRPGHQGEEDEKSSLGDAQLGGDNLTVTGEEEQLQAGGEQHEDQEQPPGGEQDHQPHHNLAGEEEGDISCNISMHIRMPGSKSQASQGGTSPMREIK